MDDHITGTIRSNCINFHEIICSYAANNFQKLEQPVFNASSLCFMQTLCCTIFISMFQLDNLLMGIIRRNYIKFYEIICSYESTKVKNLKQLV